MAHLLGIDLGTSSVKVALTEQDGAVLQRASAAYPVVSRLPGHAETDPRLWLEATARAVHDVLVEARHPEVIGVGLSGQMHGLVLARPDGTPVRPAMLHADTRAAANLDAYTKLDPIAAERLANPLSPNMAGPMLLWAADHEPEALAEARWALQPKDWLRLQLTGHAAAEPSDASATLLYDVPGDAWDRDTADALGIDPGLLAPLLPWSGAAAGTLSGSGAGLLGLPVGIPVAAGGGDTAVAAVGSGLVDPGAVQVTVGTGGQVITPLARPRAAPERGTHLYRTATPSGWYAMGAILNAGLALDRVRALLGVSWSELYGAASSPVGPSDPIFLPHLGGERTPHLDPAMRGAWVGISLDTSRAALLRAALEGVAFALRDALDALPVAPATEAVRLAGGGTAEPAWRQMLADALGRPLQALELRDVSARGAALLGGTAAGVLDPAELGVRLAPAVAARTEPDPVGVSVLAERRDRFARTVSALRAAR